jgi:chromosome segregation ATPase
MEGGENMISQCNLCGKWHEINDMCMQPICIIPSGISQEEYDCLQVALEANAHKIKQLQSANEELRAEYKSLLEAYNTYCPNADAKDTINNLTVRWGKAEREITDLVERNTTLIYDVAFEKRQIADLQKKLARCETCDKHDSYFEGEWKERAEKAEQIVADAGVEMAILREQKEKEDGRK